MPEPTDRQRAMELLRSSTKVVLVLPSADLLDPLAAAVVLGQTLVAQHKTVHFLRSAPLPAIFPRLGLTPALVSTVDTSREYQISVVSPGVIIEELSLHQAEAGYQIHLKAKSGTIRSEDLTLAEVGSPVDLVVLVGTEVLPNGVALTDVPQILLHSQKSVLPALSLSDESASSLCEVMVGIVEGVSGSAALEPKLATLLLVGLLSATESFRGPKTTAKSLTVAAQLTAAGADRQLAFTQSLESHSIATLKLWGRLLSRLSLLLDERFAWSYVTREDLIASQASEVDVPRAIDELLQSVEGADVVVVMLQETSRITGFVRRLGGSNAARAVADRLQEAGVEVSGDDTEAYFSVDGRLIDRGRELVATLSGSQVAVVSPPTVEVAA